MTEFPDSLHGMIERILFSDAENGNIAARLLPVNDAAPITIVGKLIGVMVGDYIEVKGMWRQHPQRGRYFRAQKFSHKPPVTIEELHQYFASGLIDGINAETAEQLVNYFGLATIKVLEKSPERLREVIGITAQRAARIRRGWAERKRRNGLAMLLQDERVSAALRLKIAKPQIAPREAACLAREIYSMEFVLADKIARAIGVPSNTTVRVEVGLRYIVNRFCDQGHAFMPREQLIRQASKELDVAAAVIQRTIRRFAKWGEWVVEADKRATNSRAASQKRTESIAIYPTRLHRAESSVARRLRQLLSNRNTRLAEFRNSDWPKAFNWLAVKYQIILTRKQQQAIQTALTSPISVLTGGPGTGKTATVRALILLLKKRGFTFRLAAPTGRATKRLSGMAGEPAQTLHRLLGFKPVPTVAGQAHAFERDRHARIRTDLLIVDEVSMVDLLLMNDLLSALETGSHILFVGDPDQLPSVGVGRVLRDLIDSQLIPVVALDTIFRQAKKSLIVTNAHRLNQGLMPVLSPTARDFIFIREHEPKKAAAKIVQLVTTILPANFGFDSMEDIQVLSPMHLGPAGVRALNVALQAALNPHSPRQAEWRHAGRVLRVGDKVAQTRNNYRRAVFNGEVGRIAAIDANRQLVCVDFDARRIEYAVSELDELTHAFAVSVHKAQGSEYRAVVLPLLIQHRRLLQRNLLYTAMTRAKELVVLVGTEHALERVVAKNQVTERHSRLAVRLAHPKRLGVHKKRAQK